MIKFNFYNYYFDERVTVNSFVYLKSKNLFKFYVTDPKACEVINRRLRQYEETYREDKETIKVEFQEAIFLVSQNDINFVKGVCNKFGGLKQEF